MRRRQGWRGWRGGARYRGLRVWEEEGRPSMKELRNYLTMLGVLVVRCSLDVLSRHGSTPSLSPCYEFHLSTALNDAPIHNKSHTIFIESKALPAKMKRTPPSHPIYQPTKSPIHPKHISLHDEPIRSDPIHSLHPPNPTHSTNSPH